MPKVRSAIIPFAKLSVHCVFAVKSSRKVAELPTFSIGFPLAISVKNFSNRLKLPRSQFNYMHRKSPQRFFIFECLIPYTIKD